VPCARAPPRPLVSSMRSRRGSPPRDGQAERGVSHRETVAGNPNPPTPETPCSWPIGGVVEPGNAGDVCANTCLPSSIRNPLGDHKLPRVRTAADRPYFSAVPWQIVRFVLALQLLLRRHSLHPSRSMKPNDVRYRGPSRARKRRQPYEHTASHGMVMAESRG